MAIDRCEDLNIIAYPDKKLTLLMVAAWSNSSITFVKKLLDSNADASLKSEEGKTAFDYLQEKISRDMYIDIKYKKRDIKVSALIEKYMH